ncbi:DUF3238 domain-containing protein [Bacillus sp. DX4.1]
MLHATSNPLDLYAPSVDYLLIVHVNKVGQTDYLLTVK